MTALKHLISFSKVSVSENQVQSLILCLAVIKSKLRLQLHSVSGSCILRIFGLCILAQDQM